MAQINVNRKTKDPFYRYKMPKILGKVEGRGNGIKTVLSNVIEVAKSINVPPDYPTKYIGMELGAQVILDTKNDKFIISGSHDDSKLQDLVYDFIERYVICPTCNNPETHLTVIKNNEKLKQTCQACGNVSFINSAHKFNTYIVKHPPKQKSQYQKAESKKIKIENKETKKVEKQENVVWMTDTSKEAVQQRMSELSARAAELTVNEDLELPIPDRLTIFKNKIINLIDNKDYDAIIHEVKRLELEDTAIIIICECIFQDSNVIDTIMRFKDLIARLVCTCASERNFISSIELVIARDSVNLADMVSKIFLCLYQLDLVQEETFLQWSAKKSKRYLGSSQLVDQVHKNTASFINWLKTAEEESSDDVDFEETEVKVAENTAEAYRQPPKIEESDDDINIDDI